MKKLIKIVIFVSLFLLPLTSNILNQTYQVKVFGFQEKMKPIPSDIIATPGFSQRKQEYLLGSIETSSLGAQPAKVYLGLPVDEDSIEESLDKVNSYKDTSDFDMNTLLRLMYLNRITNVLSEEMNAKIKSTVLNFKYWLTEPGKDKMYFWTENHMILFHTAELLAGQLYPLETFNNSGMTGQDHIDHAMPLINQWIDWKVKFGFAEWHSNIYFRLDLTALLNLVDFSEHEDIVVRASMLLDIIAFDFANNYFKGIYATTHGRTEDNKQLGKSIDDLPSRDSTSEPAWVMLGIGYHNPEDRSNGAAVALATSERYVPPPILENIAKNAENSHEHRERNSIDVSEAPKYGFGYEDINDLMFWWLMSAPAESLVLDATLKLMNQYELDPGLIFNDALFLDVLNIGSAVRGMSVSEYSEFISDITRGVCLETVNTYTYRTPYYQLSGAQDHHKGMNGIQQHIWQASLSEYAYVYTSSPGGVSPQEFTGGWNPRATLYKNVGIIQYDRAVQPLEAELISIVLGYRPYTHAYFPKWAFDDVERRDGWTFGSKSDSYVALYSLQPTVWVSDYELRSMGKKNLYIVELGDIEQYGSFENFMESILSSSLSVLQAPLGYEVQYNSPSRGKVAVSWDAPLTVNGNEIDLGPYERHDNKYCYQEFNTLKLEIKYGTQTLELDFELNNRNYTP